MDHEVPTVAVAGRLDRTVGDGFGVERGTVVVGHVPESHEVAELGGRDGVVPNQRREYAHPAGRGVLRDPPVHTLPPVADQ